MENRRHSQSPACPGGAGGLDHTTIPSTCLPWARPEGSLGWGERGEKKQKGKKSTLTHLLCAWEEPDFSYINLPPHHLER